MSKKIKILNKLLIFGIVFIHFSCEKNLYDEAIKEDGKMVIEKTKLDLIPIIKNAIQDKKKKITYSRQDASEYLNIIKSENVIVITDSLQQKSYTFALELEETESLTNLVIQEKNNQLEYYVVKYTSSNFEQWKNDLENHNIENGIIPIVDIENLDTPNRTNPCDQVIVTWTCPYGIHDWNTRSQCDCQDLSLWTTNVTFTEGCDTGTGSTSSGSTSPNIGGGASSSNNPCIKIKKKAINADFKANFNQLNTTVNFNQTHESGFGENIHFSGTSTSFAPLPVIGNTSVGLYSGSSNVAVGAMHVHNSISDVDDIPVKIFSPGDIYGLFELGTNSVNAGLGLDYAYIVMLSDEGTYMIKVDSMENVDTESIDWDGLKDKFRKNAEKYMDSNTNISQTKLQKLFFDTLKSANLQSKVSLYKATNVTPNSTETSQWSKVNPTTLALEPC